MGFDPRRRSADPRARQVTSNVDALLAENEALRRQLRQLQHRLELLEQRSDPSPRHNQQSKQAPSGGRVHVTTAQVDSWGQALAQQPGWSTLRAQGLETLVDSLNRQSFHPNLTLQQRLERLLPGLGQDLLQALDGGMNKKRWAVLAAFALYGVRTREWLDEDPRRVVQDLCQKMARTTSGRRTRTDQRHSDRASHRASSYQGAKQANGKARHASRDTNNPTGAPRWADPRLVECLQVLGLRWGASRDQIKQAHRRLVKKHHPDVGGSASDFHRVNAAYQHLVA